MSIAGRSSSESARSRRGEHSSGRSDRAAIVSITAALLSASQTLDPVKADPSALEPRGQHGLSDSLLARGRLRRHHQQRLLECNRQDRRSVRADDQHWHGAVCCQQATELLDVGSASSQRIERRDVDSSQASGILGRVETRAEQVGRQPIRHLDQPIGQWFTFVGGQADRAAGAERRLVGEARQDRVARAAAHRRGAEPPAEGWRACESGRRGDRRTACRSAG